MDGDVTVLLVCAGLVLVMVLYWAYYIRCVRRKPRSEKWYDDVDFVGAESDGVLFIYPYCSLIMGAGGAMGLVASANPPEFVYTVLKVPLVAAFRCRSHWIYGRGRGSASVAFCSSVGRRYPQSKACPKA